MDKKLFQFLYRLGQNSKTFFQWALVITNLSQKVFMAAYICLLFYLYIQNNPLLIKCILVPFSLLIINNLIRSTVKRPRPILEGNSDGPVAQKTSYSFPSNHSASASVIAGAALMATPIAGIILALCAFVTGASRIICGYHYPSDVCMGWFLGILFTVVGFTVF